MKKKYVLIADHDMRVCRVLGRIINRLNFECFSAHEQHTFKSLCSEIEPDIIMLNLDMAEQDNLLEYLADQHSQATIILLNNMDEDELYYSEMANQLSRLNIAGFLRKPIDFDSVKSTLERLARESKASINYLDQKKNFEMPYYFFNEKGESSHGILI